MERSNISPELINALEMLPNIDRGHFCNTKLEQDGTRLSIMRDWENNRDCPAVYVERLIDGAWVTVFEGTPDSQ